MIEIYGASDDTIVVTGDVDEEFCGPWEKPVYLAISDGTLLRIFFEDDGLWTIRDLMVGSMADTIFWIRPPDGSKTEGRSDHAFVDAKIHWVALAQNHALASP